MGIRRSIRRAGDGEGKTRALHASSSKQTKLRREWKTSPSRLGARVTFERSILLCKIMDVVPNMAGAHHTLPQRHWIPSLFIPNGRCYGEPPFQISSKIMLIHNQRSSGYPASRPSHPSTPASTPSPPKTAPTGSPKCLADLGSSSPGHYSCSKRSGDGTCPPFGY